MILPSEHVQSGRTGPDGRFHDALLRLDALVADAALMLCGLRSPKPLLRRDLAISLIAVSRSLRDAAHDACQACEEACGEA